MLERSGVKSVNWHITRRCNYKCKFCFSQNLDEEITSLEIAEEILQHLRRMGMEKINLVGGEPTLHPLFPDIVKLAKGLGFVVSIVSNGYYLNKAAILGLSPFVDWIGLSVDSADEEVEVALGRGNGSHVKKVLELAEIVHEAGIKLKINTTVTRLNWMEDMRPILRILKPHRWKVFQVLQIRGQNDLFFDELSITDEKFNHFKLLNGKGLEGITPVFEGNQEMVDSYFMLSPSGKAMSNRDGTNRVFTDLASINHQNITKVLDIQQYLDRGAVYSW